MFDSDFIKKMEYLTLVSKRTIGNRLFTHLQRKKPGSGVEFGEYRDYTHGDELRYLDWNVFARWGTLQVKQFQEEEDLPVRFFLDCSRSMNVGHPNKFDYARQVIAGLASMTLSGTQRVGMIAFDDKIRKMIPPVRGKEQIHSLFDFLRHCEPSGFSTSLQRVVTDFIHQQDRPGIAVLVSDFYDEAGFQGAIDLLRVTRQIPFLIQIHDQQERTPPLRGNVELVDCEGGITRKVTISQRNLTEYQQAFEAFLAEIRRYSVQHQIGYLVTSTEVPFDDLILRMMRESVGGSQADNKFTT